MAFRVGDFAKASKTRSLFIPVLAISSLPALLPKDLVGQLSEARTSSGTRSSSNHAVLSADDSLRKEPSSTLAKAAKPPGVHLQGGLLSVFADDSDLSEILQEISKQSGMKITGTVQHARVFGNYGPEMAPELLTELLAGLGYNVLMTRLLNSGVPEELILSPRTGSVIPPQAAPQKEEPEFGPGAIAHPKPEQDDLPQLRVYQHDQRLQRMHEAIEQQEQQGAR